jgi:phage tail sheath gpL-like
MPIITIAGFSSTDKVPGFYGETKTGQGPSSAQQAPMLCLCVGIMNTSTGTATPNVPYLMTADSDADTAFGAGYQVSRQVYAALDVPDSIVWAIGIPAASGAAAATAIIHIAGTWNTVGTIGYRINGETRTITVQSTDTPQTVATNLVNDINDQLRWPVTAGSAELGSTGVYQVTLTMKSAGKGGNQQVLFLDTTQVPSGLIGSLVADYLGTSPTTQWQATTAYGTGAWTQPTTSTGYAYKATTGGTSGSTQPTWPTTVGTTVTDGSVTWTCEFAILTGGLVPFYGGTGVESVTTALANIVNDQFDRIAPAQNDATNAAAWQSQVDSVAGPIGNILEQCVFATNQSLATAASLAQTTLNDVRCSVLWQLNGETHPCEVAAGFASLRSSLEGDNWAQGYDNASIVGVAIQSQAPDFPNHATQEAALNEGVTPVVNYNGQACILRAIVSHSLNGTAPDYSTLDTSDLTVPDQVRADVRLYWTTFFKPNNPVCSPDPPTSAGGQVAPYPPSGVAMPSTWTAQILAKLQSYERGDTFPYPQLEQGSVELYPPFTAFDPNRKCLMSAIQVVPIAQDHQIGVSVRGLQGGPSSLTS